jgi:hypothetical protein
MSSCWTELTCIAGVPSEQFKKFICEPMNSLASVGILVIVIDALDECDFEDRQSILDILAEGNIPENLRFIITTRPEDDILETLGRLPHVHSTAVNDKDVESDIKCYITARFEKFRLPFTEEEIGRLTTKADGLFQWAATACNLITERRAGVSPRTRLKRVFELDKGLDGLYEAILSEKVSSDPDERASAVTILGKVLTAAEPLPMEVLKGLCMSDEEEESVETVIPLLGSVLSVHAADVIRPIHNSFRDYLTTKTRSGVFFVDTEKAHRDLTLSTLAVMTKELRFNICDIQSSYDFNSSLTQSQLDLIAPALLYSSRFWVVHLTQSPYDEAFRGEINSFFKHRLLFWLEVLSARRAIDSAIPSMDRLVSYTKVGKFLMVRDFEVAYY